MNDKDYEAQKKRIRKYIDKWFKPIGLGWFKVEMEWERERDSNSPGTAARTHSSWQYKSATITWFLPVLADHNDETVEQTVIHEFAHVLLSGLAQNAEDNNSDYANQINEYTTELVANAIEWACEMGKDLQKKVKT